jgi:CubicO group peptidase (beta-lactamase class C family)
VVKDGKPVFRNGVADLRTLHAIGPETNFRLASLTKQFTAMAIMLLVHDGKLKYDDHLTDVFPDFPAYGKAITIRQVLNHTSGLADYESVLEKQYPGVPDEKIPQIKDAGVLEILKRQTGTKFPPMRWSTGIRYVPLAMAAEKNRMSFGDSANVSSFRRHETNHRFPGKNEAVTVRMVTPAPARIGARLTRVRPRQRLATEGSTRRSTIWKNGTAR